MNTTPIQGHALVFGDDVDTDQIIPARYLVTTDPVELGQNCMADSPRPFEGDEARGGIVVAGRNFGCGSSREHAPLALLGAGVRVVVAHSFARIFFRNAINVGLTVVESATSGIEDGAEVEVDVARGIVRAGDACWSAAPLPTFVTEIVEAGGLVEWARAELEREAATAGGAA